MNLYSIIFFIVSAAILAVYLFDRFSGKEILIRIIQWQPAIAALTALAKAMASALPSSEFATVVAILDAASKATQKAEKLYLINELAKEDRNVYAKGLITDMLTEAGIDITQPVEDIVDGCIAVICMLMPHGVEPVDPSGDPVLT